ncbi:DUF4329 domain-containing protein [Halioxenophilus aromaticivorans]|uniref:DUF4329 domain-containing protein n=1 Tax=Halioxenophilus aromaticivorans TaxID=1306992 RepID=A0AAV3U6H4_9ALTE
MRPLATFVNSEFKRTLGKALVALTIGLSFASAGQAATVAELANEVFVSETAAVTAAANRYNPQSIAQDKEYMGAVYQCEEGHRYSVGAGKVGAGNVTVTLRTPQGCKTVALWHTHGAEHRSHKYFSDIDTRLVEQVGLPFYMADYTGSLRVFEPGDRTMTYSEARRLGLGSSNQYARGSLVTDQAGETLAVATHSHGQQAVALNH